MCGSSLTRVLALHNVTTWRVISTHASYVANASGSVVVSRTLAIGRDRFDSYPEAAPYCLVSSMGEHHTRNVATKVRLLHLALNSSRPC